MTAACRSKRSGEIANRDDAYLAADPLAGASYDALEAAEREYWEAIDRANEALWRAEADAYENGSDTSAAHAEYAAAERAAANQLYEALETAWRRGRCRC